MDSPKIRHAGPAIAEFTYMRAHAIDYNARVRSLGCDVRPDGRAFFRLWAPDAKRVQLHLLFPADRLLDMRAIDHGYHELEVANLKPGVRYKYRLGDEEFPIRYRNLNQTEYTGPAK